MAGRMSHRAGTWLVGILLAGLPPCLTHAQLRDPDAGWSVRCPATWSAESDPYTLFRLPGEGGSCGVHVNHVVVRTPEEFAEFSAREAGRQPVSANASG